jgi:hypothetical protein
MKAEFISYRMSCITLTDSWCDIIVLNVHESSDDKGDDMKE